MLETSTRTKQAVLESLDKWHRMVASGDFASLGDIVHPDAVFRSPTMHHPFETAAAVVLAVTTVSEILEEFEYLRHFAGDDFCSVIIEFGATVRGKRLKGVDMIRFDDIGKIVEFEVMVRPKNALQVIYEIMTEKVGKRLSALSTKRA